MCSSYQKNSLNNYHKKYTQKINSSTPKEVENIIKTSLITLLDYQKNIIK